METALEQIREQQRQTWNKFSAGWKKWDELTGHFLAPMGDAIISSLQLKDTDSVLDIATGTGDPGLAIALIVKNGKVVGTDLSDEMLTIANENAKNRGIKNYSTQACDVCELPFTNNSFDAVSCRFGFMFFPDMLMAAKEMVRVLKPGGTLATTVWAGPDKNAWITTSMNTINRNMGIQSPPPGAPGIFRCALPGLISGLLRQAGLTDLVEKTISGKMDYGSNELYWSYMTEIAAPVVATLANADAKMKEEIRTEIFTNVNNNYPGANFPFESIIVSGKK